VVLHLRTLDQIHEEVGSIHIKDQEKTTQKVLCIWHILEARRIRSYLGPAGYAGTGGAAVGPRSGSGDPGRAGLSEPCVRPWHPQAGVGDTGRHRPAEATAREVRGCPHAMRTGPAGSGAVAGPAISQGGVMPWVKQRGTCQATGRRPF
jgi:hypothetical protein